jgi:hypothetical protein
MNTSVGMDSGLAEELVIGSHFGPDPLAAILNDGRERMLIDFRQHYTPPELFKGDPGRSRSISTVTAIPIIS